MYSILSDTRSRFVSDASRSRGPRSCPHYAHGGAHGGATARAALLASPPFSAVATHQEASICTCGSRHPRQVSERQKHTSIAAGFVRHARTRSKIITVACSSCFTRDSSCEASAHVERTEIACVACGSSRRDDRGHGSSVETLRWWLRCEFGPSAHPCRTLGLRLRLTANGPFERWSRAGGWTGRTP